VRDRFDLHADGVFAETFAVVLLVAQHQIFEAWDSGEGLETRDGVGSFFHCVQSIAGAMTQVQSAPRKTVPPASVSTCHRAKVGSARSSAAFLSSTLQ
jgi:hypothetical protein